jgi:hypothetical protein
VVEEELAVALVLLLVELVVLVLLFLITRTHLVWPYHQLVHQHKHIMVLI